MIKERIQAHTGFGEAAGPPGLRGRPQVPALAALEARSQQESHLPPRVGLIPYPASSCLPQGTWPHWAGGPPKSGEETSEMRLPDPERLCLSVYHIFTSSPHCVPQQKYRLMAKSHISYKAVE